MGSVGTLAAPVTGGADPGQPCPAFRVGWIVQARGQLTDIPPLLTAAEQLLETNDSSASESGHAQTRILRALITMFWSEFQYFTGQPQASWQSARSALEWIPPGEEYIANLALLFMSFSRQANGQEEVALAQLQQALRDQSTKLKRHCSPALCSGNGVSGCRQTAPGGTHRTALTPARHRGSI